MSWAGYNKFGFIQHTIRLRRAVSLACLRSMPVVSLEAVVGGDAAVTAPVAPISTSGVALQILQAANLKVLLTEHWLVNFKSPICVPPPETTGDSITVRPSGRISGLTA